MLHDLVCLNSSYNEQAIVPCIYGHCHCNFLLEDCERIFVSSLEQMEMVLHMYVRGLHKLRMSYCVSQYAITFLRTLLYWFLSSKGNFRWINRFFAFPIRYKLISADKDNVHRIIFCSQFEIIKSTNHCKISIYEILIND